MNEVPSVRAGESLADDPGVGDVADQKTNSTYQEAIHYRAQAASIFASVEDHRQVAALDEGLDYPGSDAALRACDEVDVVHSSSLACGVQRVRIERNVIESEFAALVRRMDFTIAVEFIYQSDSCAC